MTITNETQQEKTQEQIASEQVLLAMPDDESGEQPGANQEQKSETDEAGALMVAAFALKGVVAAVEAVYPCLDGFYTPEIQEQGALKLVPLMQKYNMQSEFLERWQVELEAGMFFGGMVFAGYKLVQMDAELAKNKAKEKEVFGDGNGQS